MLALAGYPLGLAFRFLESKSPSPVDGLGEVVPAEYDDLEGILSFRRGLDVVTYEFENVPTASARALEEILPVHPPADALRMAQDRLREKAGFETLGIPTAAFHGIDSLDDLMGALEELGAPAVLKTRRFGYDGKGQWVLRSVEEAASAWEELDGRPALLEAFVPFDRELSILAVRGRAEETAFYPLVENTHAEGILRMTVAPAPAVDAALQRRAEGYATRLLDELGYVGVLALELFERDGELLANEIAPRVHNSGHWSQDGAECCQFENHLRAVCGLPLGSTRPLGVTTMINLIGRTPPSEDVLSYRNARLHLYGKSPRPGRKLGHVNVVDSASEEGRRAVEAIERMTE
jgi:5-(carboxyamino)imidazole ribonucleotide synthase